MDKCQLDSRLTIAGFVCTRHITKLQLLLRRDDVYPLVTPGYHLASGDGAWFASFVTDSTAEKVKKISAEYEDEQQ